MSNIVIHHNRDRFPLVKWCRPITITVDNLVVWSGNDLSEVKEEQWIRLAEATEPEKWSLYGAIKAML